MDQKRHILVNSIIEFLKSVLEGKSLDEEKKESLEVAIQCLETAFEVENDSNIETVDLISLVDLSNVVVTDEQKEKAEEHKNRGNNFMKNSEYKEAVAEYSKAIQLNSNNAVYYCNRAAAYTRLCKDEEAIIDCNEAIKLDPTYGKAYGRLGIAYSNLNRCDQALEAYKNALKYDPTNTMYQTNLKVAQERLQTNAGTTTTPSLNMGQLPENFSQIIRDPNIVNMANQLFSDQNFHSIMTGFMNNMQQGAGGDGMPAAVETMLQAGQALAQRLVNEDPEYYQRIARTAQAAASDARQGTQDTQNAHDTNGESTPPDSSSKKNE